MLQIDGDEMLQTVEGEQYQQASQASKIQNVNFQTNIHDINN